MTNLYMAKFNTGTVNLDILRVGMNIREYEKLDYSRLLSYCTVL